MFETRSNLPSSFHTELEAKRVELLATLHRRHKASDAILYAFDLLRRGVTASADRSIVLRLRRATAPLVIRN
jgi:hypothetical protein